MPRVLHLVSDSTGETVTSVMRACLVQFADGPVHEYLWPFVHTPGQVEHVLQQVAENPGFVLFTLVNEDLGEQLAKGCQRLGVPFNAVLAPVMDALHGYLGARNQRQTGAQHRMDENYFRRMEAVDFAVTHDDGHGQANLAAADVVLVGVSRTSKTPCCVYLGYRGIRAANVPLVHERPLPEALLQVAASPKPPLIVGLTQDPQQLQAIRQNRLRDLTGDMPFDYTDFERIRAEIQWARRLFTRHGWPVIDVSRRSVEETATLILQMLHRDPKSVESV